MVKDHRIDLIELVISEWFMGNGFIIPKGDGILLIHHDAFLKARVLQRGTGLRLVQACTSRRHDMVEGADGLAGGLHPQVVCQIEGFDGIIKCRGAIVGSTRSVGQGIVMYQMCLILWTWRKLANETNVKNAHKICWKIVLTWGIQTALAIHITQSQDYPYAKNEYKLIVVIYRTRMTILMREMNANI